VNDQIHRDRSSSWSRHEVRNALILKLKITVFRNVGNHSLNNTASYPRRFESSCDLFLVYTIGLAFSGKVSKVSVNAAGEVPVMLVTKTVIFDFIYV